MNLLSGLAILRLRESVVLTMEGSVAFEVPNPLADLVLT
jgi:hypothetical protein